MFWRIGRKRDTTAEDAREREAFLRRLREVLDPYFAASESAMTLCESIFGRVAGSLVVDAEGSCASRPLSPSSRWASPVADARP